MTDATVLVGVGGVDGGWDGVDVVAADGASGGSDLDVGLGRQHGRRQRGADAQTTT